MIQLHMYICICMYFHLLISTILETVGNAIPNLFNADKLTVMLSANTPLGNVGAVNVSVVVGLGMFLTAPL